MTNLIEATLLQRISDLNIFIAYVVAVEDAAGPTKTGDKLLTHLRRELATEQGNLRRLRLEDMEGDLYWERVTLETGQPGSSGEGVGDGTQ